MEAVRYAKQGYKILLIGHAGHDEVVGTFGEAPDVITIVESPQDVENLKFPPTEKLAYLTQTTPQPRRRERDHRGDQNANTPTLKPRQATTSATPPPTGSWRSSTWPPTRTWSWSWGLRTAPTRYASLRSPSTWARPRTWSTTRPRSDHAWFEGVQTVLVTAGASARSTWSRRSSRTSPTATAASPAPATSSDEDMHFELPVEPAGAARWPIASGDGVDPHELK